MVNDRLHIICGNCGATKLFTAKIDLKGQDLSNNDGEHFEPEVTLHCQNCSTIHPLSSYMEVKNEST